MQTTHLQGYISYRIRGLDSITRRTRPSNSVINSRNINLF